MRSTSNKWAVVAGMLLATGLGQASELVYNPINPSFGGNPMYGSYLLGSAQATSKHEDKGGQGNGSPFASQTPLEQFNETLERSILSQLASAATSQVLQNGKFVPGVMETEGFRVNVIDLGGGNLKVVTTDKLSGAQNEFQVRQP